MTQVIEHIFLNMFVGRFQLTNIQSVKYRMPYSAYNSIFICKTIIKNMKKLNINLGTIVLLLVFLTFYSCEKDEMIEEEMTIFPEKTSDEDIGEYTTCTDEGTNTVRETDIANPVNTGTIDDRSCYANYKQSFISEKIWGVYNITDGSNHMDAAGTLQPRIERALTPNQNTDIGSYTKFTATVRILEVGDTSGDSNDGTYIMQTKGQHTGGGGSADPAICLYLAKPVYGMDSLGNEVQVSFDIHREQINYRGGSGADGRDIIFLTNVLKNEQVDIELEVGFREDPNNSGQKIHYSDAVIGGEVFNWNIPEPERATQSKIRYGAYRVKGGRAQIRWTNTTHENVF